MDSKQEQYPELIGSIVALRPMAPADAHDLLAAARYPELWLWTVSQITSLADMKKYVAEALSERDAGTSIPFVTTDVLTGEVIGSSRFGNISREHRRVEIGWTWLTPSRQRSGANNEAKLLMLSHAFETMNCIRVELKTDALNHKSRDAIRRIGATEEGILRNHVINKSGRIRDTVYHSILIEEWPAVRERLAARLIVRDWRSKGIH